MLKHEERSNPDSCWNKADENEFVFVVVEHDITSPGTIRDWCARRIKAGKNKPDDVQIQDALRQAKYVEARQAIRQAAEEARQTI